MCICDFIRDAGRQSDGGVFANSGFGQSLEKGEG